MVLLSDPYVGVYAALSGAHAALLGMLIGSVASAEERKLSTIEWQVLQPIAMWKQWSVKAGVVMGLAMFLGVGLATVVASVGPVTYAAKSPSGLQLASIVLLLTAGSFYVSSLCSSGAWALVMSAAATLGAVWFQAVALRPLGNVSHAVLYRLFTGWARSNVDLRWWDPLQMASVLDLLFIVAFIAIVARFALTNHRSADRPFWRVGRQAILLGVFVTVRVAMLSGVAALFGRPW
jgi:hypothetical protein